MDFRPWEKACNLRSFVDHAWSPVSTRAYGLGFRVWGLGSRILLAKHCWDLFAFASRGRSPALGRGEDFPWGVGDCCLPQTQNGVLRAVGLPRTQKPTVSQESDKGVFRVVAYRKVGFEFLR